MSNLRFAGLSVLASLCLFACSAPEAAEAGADESELGAETTLTFPLVAYEYKGGEWATIPLASLNEEITAAGLKPFAKSITVGRSEADKAAFQAIADEVTAVNEKLGREIELVQDWDPSQYIGLCHTGSVAGVRLTVEALRGVAFGEYMGMAGYRFKSTKKFLYGMDEAEFFQMHVEGGNEDVVKVWNDFDASSDAFLMLTDGGQQGDGTELFATVIPKCQ